MYSIEIKPFKSQLFKRIIKPDNPSFGSYLDAGILFRLKVLEDRKCPCKKCYMDKHNLEWHISEMENDCKIEKNFRPPDDKTFGNFGRAELPPRFKIK